MWEIALPNSPGIEAPGSRSESDRSATIGAAQRPQSTIYGTANPATETQNSKLKLEIPFTVAEFAVP